MAQSRILEGLRLEHVPDAAKGGQTRVVSYANCFFSRSNRNATLVPGIRNHFRQNSKFFQTFPSRAGFAAGSLDADALPAELEAVHTRRPQDVKLVANGQVQVVP